MNKPEHISKTANILNLMLSQNNPCPCCGTEKDYPGNCDACIEKFDEQAEADRAAQEIERIKTFLDKTIPERFKNAELSDFKEWPRIVGICRGWLENPIDSLMIFGPVGTGKTHLCYAMAKELIIKKHSNLIFVDCPEMMESMRTGRDRCDEKLDTYQRVACLFLDDIGREKVSDFTEEKLYMVINARYDHCRPTIFTSNLDLKQIENHLKDSRVPDRMAEMCKGRMVNLRGKSRRLNGK